MSKHIDPVDRLPPDVRAGVIAAGGVPLRSAGGVRIYGAMGGALAGASFGAEIGNTVFPGAGLLLGGIVGGVGALQKHPACKRQFPKIKGGR